MRFWTWALEAYARPGAAEACLRLQDRYSQCVPYLLWAAWAAAEGRRLDDAALAAGADLSRRWQDAAIAPLRAARRAMKPSVEGVPDGARETLRAEVKALELKTEQLLIDTLESLTPASAAPPLDLAGALAQAARAWAAPPPPSEALAGLAQTLS